MAKQLMLYGFRPYGVHSLSQQIFVQPSFVFVPGIDTRIMSENMNKVSVLMEFWDWETEIVRDDRRFWVQGGKRGSRRQGHLRNQGRASHGVGPEHSLRKGRKPGMQTPGEGVSVHGEQG